MILSSIFFTLLISIASLFLINPKKIKTLKFIALSCSSLVLILSCLLLIEFDTNSYFFQYVTTYSLGSRYLNLIYVFGLDGISIFFFVLSTLLIFVCILFT